MVQEKDRRACSQAERAGAAATSPTKSVTGGGASSQPNISADQIYRAAAGPGGQRLSLGCCKGLKLERRWLERAWRSEA